uniref:Uncharacterized protein n=1 Tax=Oryza brachyantha TaxID=4533 RepID=J3N7U3_ORYBR
YVLVAVVIPSSGHCFSWVSRPVGHIMPRLSTSFHYLDTGGPCPPLLCAHVIAREEDEQCQTDTVPI